MSPWSNATFSFFAALSISVETYFIKKADIHSYYIYACSLLSPIITISLIFASESYFLIAVCLLGWFYGIFLLRFFMSFSELTMIRERGRIGGLIGFISILVMSSLTVVSLVFGFIGSVVLCSLLSICLLFTARLATIDPAKSTSEKTFSLKISYSRDRDFFLYLMPWVIYNLLNAFLGRYETTSLIDRLQLPFIPMMILLNVTSCIGALVGGLIADIYGRKKSLGIGLTSYGIGGAFCGLIFLGIQDSLLIFLLFALNGLSWGIFLVLYFLVVWEDLSNMNNRFFYYIGVVFYPLSIGLAQFLPSSIQISLVNLALVKCVLIFASNVFLIAAKELLSPELRKEFDVFVYLEQVKALFKKHHEESD